MVELWRKRPDQHFGPIVAKVSAVFSFCGQSNMPGLLISVSQGFSHCLSELSITAALWVFFKTQSHCTLWIVNSLSRIFLFFFLFFSCPMHIFVFGQEVQKDLSIQKKSILPQSSCWFCLFETYRRK